MGCLCPCQWVEKTKTNPTPTGGLKGKNKKTTCDNGWLERKKRGDGERVKKIVYNVKYWQKMSINIKK